MTKRANTDLLPEELPYTLYPIVDADPELGVAFRTFILGSLSPDDYAKNAVDSAEDHICEVFKDSRDGAFPMCVLVDSGLYLISDTATSNIKLKGSYLRTPKMLMTAYAVSE